MLSNKEKYTALTKTTQLRTLGLAFLLMFTFSYFYQGGFSNQLSRFDMALAIAFEHTLSIDSFHTNTLDKATYEGHYYSEKALGTAYLMTAVLSVVSLVTDLKYWTAHPQRMDFLLYWTTLLTVGLFCTVAALAFRDLLVRLRPNLTTPFATQITLLTFFGTTIFPYTTMAFSHMVSGSFLILGTWFGVRAAENSQSKPVVLNGLAASFCFGYAVLSEYPSVILASGLFFVVFLRAKNRKLLFISTGAAMIPLFAIFVHNYLTFGDIFSLGYGKLQETDFAGGISEGWFGISYPSLDAIWGLSFSPFRGIFIYSPLLFAALWGWYKAPRDIFLLTSLPIIASCTLLLLIISSFSYWEGSTCFGPRHLVPAIPFLCIGLIYLPERLRRSTWFTSLATISIFINFCGTATTPFVDEIDKNPLFASHFPLYFSGQFMINPLAALTPVTETVERWQHFDEYSDVSFNLGQLLGLSGYLSFLPLALIWATAWWLVNLTHSEK